jgi:hypothetical protein
MQTFVFASNPEQFSPTCSIEDCQIVLDKLNNEFGSEAVIIRYDRSLFFDQHDSSMGLIEFEKDMREYLEKVMTESLRAQIAGVNAYVHCSFYDGDLPALLNTTPWAVETMIRIIIEDDYD